VGNLGKGVHNLVAGNDACKIYLTNAAPDANNHVGKANLAEITAANGYNNAAITNNWTLATNIATLSGANVTWTATGGNFGPFRYVVLYDDTPTTPVAKPLIAYWDYGSAINCNNGESFTWAVPVNGTIANLT
jgi:hypothetical protein